jgi:hypothetical protein
MLDKFSAHVVICLVILGDLNTVHIVTYRGYEILFLYGTPKFIYHGVHEILIAEPLLKFEFSHTLPRKFILILYIHVYLDVIYTVHSSLENR